MRLAAAALLFLPVLLAAPDKPAQAQARYYPWCAHYGGGEMGSAISCGFDTYAQCRATISGVGGVCMENVAAPPRPYVAARKKNRAQH
jgi:hypothetical protein